MARTLVALRNNTYSENRDSEFYGWASGVDIPACAAAEIMGEIMSTNVMRCADATWTAVMAPRLENVILR